MIPIQLVAMVADLNARLRSFPEHDRIRVAITPEERDELMWTLHPGMREKYPIIQMMGVRLVVEEGFTPKEKENENPSS